MSVHTDPQCLAPCIIPEIEFGQVRQALGSPALPNTGQSYHCIESQVGNMSVGQKLQHGADIVIDCREDYEVRPLSPP